MSDYTSSEYASTSTMRLLTEIIIIFQGNNFPCNVITELQSSVKIARLLYIFEPGLLEFE